MTRAAAGRSRAPSLRRVVATTACATTAGVLPAFLLGSQAVQVKRDLGFGDALLGSAIALSWAAAAVASTPMGRLGERIGGGRGLRAAAALNALVMVAVGALARSWMALAVGMVVAGVGNALTQPSANLLMARTVPLRRQGFAFAVKQSAMPFGALLGGLAVPTLTLTVGWRWTFGVAGALAAVAALAVPVHVEASGAPPDGGSDRSTARPGRAPGRGRGRLDTPLPVLAVLATGVGLGAACASVQTAFLVSGAVASGLAEGAAGLVLTVGSALGITARLLAGVRADTRGGGHLRVVAWMMLGGAVAYLGYALGEPWAYVAATPLAFAAGWAWPGLFNLAVVRANPHAPGLATSVTQTGTYLGAGIGPLVFGAVVVGSGYGRAWIFTAGAAVAAAGAVLVGRARLRRGRTDVR